MRWEFSIREHKFSRWMEQGVSTKGCGEVCACLEKKERTLIEEISRYENEIVRLDENMTVTDAYRKMNRIEYEEN